MTQIFEFYKLMWFYSQMLQCYNSFVSFSEGKGESKQKLLKNSAAYSLNQWRGYHCNRCSQNKKAPEKTPRQLHKFSRQTITNEVIEFLDLYFEGLTKCALFDSYEVL